MIMWSVLISYCVCRRPSWKPNTQPNGSSAQPSNLKFWSTDDVFFSKNTPKKIGAYGPLQKITKKIGDCGGSLPTFRKQEPDYPTLLPDYPTCVTARLPDFTAQLYYPTARLYYPTTRLAALPDYPILLPDFTTRLPDYLTLLPDLQVG